MNTYAPSLKGPRSTARGTYQREQSSDGFLTPIDLRERSRGHSIADNLSQGRSNSKHMSNFSDTAGSGFIGSFDQDNSDRHGIPSTPDYGRPASLQDSEHNSIALMSDPGRAQEVPSDQSGLEDFHLQPLDETTLSESNSPTHDIRGSITPDSAHERI